MWHLCGPRWTVCVWIECGLRSIPTILYVYSFHQMHLHSSLCVATFTVIILCLPHIDGDFATLEIHLLSLEKQNVVSPPHLIQFENSLGRHRNYSPTKRTLSHTHTQACMAMVEPQLDTYAVHIRWIHFSDFLSRFFYFIFFICCALPVFVSAFSLPPPSRPHPPTPHPLWHSFTITCNSHYIEMFSYLLADRHIHFEYVLFASMVATTATAAREYVIKVSRMYAVKTTDK